MEKILLSISWGVITESQALSLINSFSVYCESPTAPQQTRFDCLCIIWRKKLTKRRMNDLWSGAYKTEGPEHRMQLFIFCRDDPSPESKNLIPDQTQYFICFFRSHSVVTTSRFLGMHVRTCRQFCRPFKIHGLFCKIIKCWSFSTA